MANIALNKTVDASHYMFPYTPAKGVDGNLTPLSRWVGSSPLPPEPAIPSPVWYRVDLGAFYWINRWVVKQMGSVGWSANYNLTDYKLQGSLDNANWFDIDSVTNNSANQTDRAFSPTKVRWARIYVTKGLRCNTNFASIVELELYPADPTSAKLSGLTINPGTLVPAFVNTTYSYTASVGYDTTSMTVTPTVEDSRATIKVNGAVATSGQPFTVNNLVVGSNPVTVQVTPYIGDPQNYVITVTRDNSPYLSALILKVGKNNINISPTFAPNTLLYTASATADPITITVTPTAQDPTAGITVNNQPVGSGSPINTTLTSLPKNITIVVTSSSSASDQKTYTITVSR